MTTLGDDLPVQMKRVRDKVIPAYESIGPSGQFAIAMMKADLDKAAKAMIEGDIVALVQVWDSLKGYEL